MPSTALYFLNEKCIPSEWNLIILFSLSLTALEYISHENVGETINFLSKKKQILLLKITEWSHYRILFTEIYSTEHNDYGNDKVYELKISCFCTIE